MSDDITRLLMAEAGITEAEIKYDSKSGWLISPSAVRKLCFVTPDTKAKMDLLASVQKLAPIA